jgi:hypothetical protein
MIVYSTLTCGSGGAIEVGSPFSQSSSTMSINGQMESRMQSSREIRTVDKY